MSLEITPSQTMSKKRRKRGSEGVREGNVRGGGGWDELVSPCPQTVLHECVPTLLRFPTSSFCPLLSLPLDLQYVFQDLDICKRRNVIQFTIHCKDKMPKIWNKYSQKRIIGASVPIYIHVHVCAAKAFYSCPAIISHRPESQKTPKEPQ